MADDFEAGVLLIDKPAGPSSFTIVKRIRYLLQIKKVGHAGTLDPFASGLLLVCVGRSATRIVSQLMATYKVYEAVMQLGVETDTQDPEGQVIARTPVETLDDVVIDRCLAHFTGDQFQVPPHFSAVKFKGKPLYKYARQGIKVEKEPRPVHIHQIQRLGYEEDRLAIRVGCSKGVYIRTLAADIGARLGFGAHLTALRRVRIGPFSVDDAIDGSLLTDDAGNMLVEQALSVEDVLAKIKKEQDQVASKPHKMI